MIGQHMKTEKVEATVTKMGETGTFCFATDDWGRSYFVHRKNVSEIGEKVVVRRPVVWYVASTVYVAPLMLEIIANICRPGPTRGEACHRGCPTGAAWHGVYSCVDLAHLAWGSREENEADKRG